MIVTYIVADDAECDFREIRSILNAGQTFFSLSPAVRLSLRQLRTPDGAPPSLSMLRDFLAQRGVVVSSDSSILLLTSREIDDRTEPGSMDAFAALSEDRFVAISNYRTPLEGRAADLTFVRRSLHALMRQCVERPIVDNRCVCGPGRSFLYLSTPAEDELKRLGHRDGIRDLFRFINWLNQTETNPKQPSLKEPPVSGLPLADHFARIIANTEGRPFENKIVLMVLHFLSDLIPFVANVLRLGAKPEDIYLVAKPYPYPRRDKISHTLEQHGIQFRRATDTESVKDKAAEILGLLHTRADMLTKQILVIEDGGYFAPLLHQAANKKLISRCVGIVEQTTKGIRNSEREISGGPLRTPILSVAKSTFKELYESPEIGRATVQNISRFVPNIKLSGKRAVVFGFGSIGVHVAESLNRAFNMGVSVVDSDPQRLLLANHRKDIVTEARSSFAKLRHRDETILVVGTTGGGRKGRPSVTARLMTRLPKGTILVSTSSDRVEFDVEGLRRLACNKEEHIEEGNTKYTFTVGKTKKSLFLLAEGYPINFYGSDSVPNETIDPIMTILMLCGVSLCQHPKRFKKKIDAEVVDEITGTQGRNVAAEYSRISRRD